MKKLTLTSFFSIGTIVIMIIGAGCITNPQSITYQSSTKPEMFIVSSSTTEALPSTPTSTQTSTTISVQKTTIIFSTSTVKRTASREFLMGYTKDRTILPIPNYSKINDIVKNNRLTGFTEQPINFYSVSSTNYQVPFPCTMDTSTLGKYEEYYCFNNDLYTFKVENSEKIGTIAEIEKLLHNGNVVVTGICWDNASEPIEDIRIVNNKLAFTFVQNCDPNNSHQLAQRNIYYNGETFNEKYGVQGTHYLFAYQEKLGFVIKINDKEYIFFNNKIVSPAYDKILTYGCCTNPHYLEVFKNGKLDFMAVKEEKDYLVEIDLNPYL